MQPEDTMSGAAQPSGKDARPLYEEDSFNSFVEVISQQLAHVSRL